MKRVLSIVLNSFVTDSRVLKECISLRNNGFKVQVVALHKAQLKEHELIHGIPVHRVKLKTRKLPRFFLTQLIKLIELVIIIIGKYRKFDIIHCNDLDPLPVGYLIKKIFNRKAKLVYDAHEYESERDPRQSRFKKIFLQKVEAFFIKHADAVFTVSDSIANDYMHLYKIPKPLLILNCPPYTISRKSKLLRQELSIKDNQIVFLYQGGFSPGRGIKLILNTFSKIADNSKSVVFMGYGPLQSLIEKYSVSYGNIFFFPAVSSSDVVKYASSADIGLLLYEDICLNHRYCMPNKLFEYIMSGLPIIVSDLPEIKKVVVRNNIGLVFKGKTSENLRNMIENIDNSQIAQMKYNTAVAAKKYNWENQEMKLVQAYQNLI